MRKLSAPLIALASLIALAFAPSAQAKPLTSTGPGVRVGGGDLVTVGTGYQWWARSPGVRRPMGSIAKVMTALVVLDAGHLNREIKVTAATIRYVRKDGASSAGLIKGDRLTTRELLEAMLLPSGCDAAFLLATSYGPGRAAFIAKMNATALRLGMTSTHFTSFDGMPYPTEHSTYSTPADLVKLGLAAMKYPVFRRIVRQHSFYLPKTTSHHSYLWYTTDGLLRTYHGAEGIKTGDTKAAGNCLLFEAKRDGRTLLGVVLHASPNNNPVSAINTAAQVLNWGFSQVKTASPAAIARTRAARVPPRTQRHIPAS
ncbi:MAG TPA: D-alanyl-D-alanine carboxypeptidase [Streptosporangiaceae bacterium]|nr:D-alanyl-D-alanine carboxypeptidase [Streptosporangiaceae bacterium]